MWMMGCKDNTSLSISDSGEGQIRRELGAQVSSRWNPTTEQLRTLEELYRRGMRTPTADQIQYITSQLRRYGKIEGKNVFYWFQNHKTRESQKRRKTNAAIEFDCYFERNDSERRWIGFEQTKEWVSRSCSIRPQEPILFSRSPRTHSSSERFCMNSLQFYEATAKEEANKDQDLAETSTVETLQLFPLHSDPTSSSISTSKNSFILPKFNHSHRDLIQFFQFLPLKN